MEGIPMSNILFNDHFLQSKALVVALFLAVYLALYLLLQVITLVLNTIGDRYGRKINSKLPKFYIDKTFTITIQSINLSQEVLNALNVKLHYNCQFEEFSIEEIRIRLFPFVHLVVNGKFMIKSQLILPFHHLLKKLAI